MTRLARNNQTVDYSELLPEIGCFGFRHEKAGGTRLRLILGGTYYMETVKSAFRQHGKTVRIITDLPVLVQSENTLTRKGRSKPVVFMLGQLRFTVNFTDSGEPVVKIDEPP